MFADFRRMFFPTKEELIKDYKRIIKLHNNQIGQCSTCTHHIPTEEPGFVTDYGKCHVNSTLFLEKVCGLINVDCSYYIENIDEISKLKTELKKLEGK